MLKLTEITIDAFVILVVEIKLQKEPISFSIPVVELAFILLTSMTISGCGARVDGSSVPAIQPPPMDRDLLSLIPERATGVLWFDLKKIRSSALWEAFKIVSGDQDLGRLTEITGVDSFDKYDEVVFSLASGDRAQSDDFLVLAKGAFDTAVLLQSVLKRNDGRAEKKDGFDVARTDKYVFVPLTKSAFAIGTPPMTAKLIDLIRGKGKSLRQETGFRDVALTDAIAARLFYRRDLITPDFTRFGAWPPAIEAESIQSVDGKLDLRKGLKAQIAITAQTQLDASNLARSIRRAQRRLGKNMIVILFGIDWMLDKFTTSVEQSTVSILLELDSRDLEELKHLAERVNKMRELASQTPQEALPDLGGADDSDISPGGLEKQP